MKEPDVTQHVQALEYALKKCKAMPDYHSASSTFRVAGRVAELLGVPASLVEHYEDELTDFYTHKNEPVSPLQQNTTNNFYGNKYDIGQNNGPMGDVAKQEFLMTNVTTKKLTDHEQ